MKKFGFLFFVFLVLFANFASAEVFVTLSKSSEDLTLYPLESTVLELSVLNSGSVDVQGLNFNVLGSNGDLVFLEGGEQLKSLNFDINKISFGETFSREIVVKPLRVSSKKIMVTVEYGQKVFSNSTSIVLNVVENPLKLKSKISSNGVNLGEEFSISVDFENSGTDRITNLKAFLDFPDGFEVVSSPSIPESLDAGQSIKNVKFVLNPKEKFDGKKTIKLISSYVQGNGAHKLEENFELQMENKGFIFQLIAGIIVGLIVLSFFFQPPKAHGSAKTHAHSSASSKHDSASPSSGHGADSGHGHEASAKEHASEHSEHH
ncbi:MAG: hypothetical protein Q7K42_04925 [Candidatus Diapherotrites archaeon]|nr:hypothetical protein [Candidatus Diapherotrites archaeon]